MPKRRAASAAAAAEEEATAPRRGRRTRADAVGAARPPAEEEAAAPRRSLRTRGSAGGAAEPPAARPPGQLRVGTSGYRDAAWRARGGLYEGLAAAAEPPRYAFYYAEINPPFSSGAAGRASEVLDRWCAEAEAADAAAPSRAPLKFAIKVSVLGSELAVVLWRGGVI
jgi:hypothetical protein